jgi:acyl-CoA thioester hydrolase
MNMPGAVPRIHRTDIQVRFNDTDAMGHLNNTSYASYAELARLDFFAQLGEQSRALILAHLAIDFRHQVRLGEAVHVRTWVERLGKSSITLRQEVIAQAGTGDVCAAEMRSVVVCFDYETDRSREMPAAVRAAMLPYVAAAV